MRVYVGVTAEAKWERRVTQRPSAFIGNSTTRVSWSMHYAGTKGQGEASGIGRERERRVRSVRHDRANLVRQMIDKPTRYHPFRLYSPTGVIEVI